MRRDGGRRRRRELRRQAEKLLRKAPQRRPGEGDREYAERLRPWFLRLARTDIDEMWPKIVETILERGAEAQPAELEPWVALARRFGRREGGAIHVTNPATGLLERYGYGLEVPIVLHFERAGTEGGVRSYWRVGSSPNEERVGVVYAPDQDAVVVWRMGEREDDPDPALTGELDEDLVAGRTAGDEEKEHALAAMPRRGPHADPEGWWTDVWDWQWGMELAYAEDWRYLQRVGEAIYGEAGTESPLAPIEPDPRTVAEVEELMVRKVPPGYVRGLLDAGLNCTTRASMVMQNDGARAENASGLFDSYVRLCREREERVFATYDVSTGEGEWLLCAWRVPGEGRVTVGLSDELAPTDDVPVARAGHLCEVFRP